MSTGTKAGENLGFLPGFVQQIHGQMKILFGDVQRRSEADATLVKQKPIHQQPGGPTLLHHGLDLGSAAHVEGQEKAPSTQFQGRASFLGPKSDPFSNDFTTLQSLGNQIFIPYDLQYS